MANSVPERSRRRLRSTTHAVTLSDVAEVAGVSPQTVSRALRTPEDVAPATREKINKAVAASGYVPNLAARHLASNRSRLVATVVPSISTSVFADTMTAANDVLAPAGYQLILGFTEYNSVREEQLIRELLGRRPDGVLLVGNVHTEHTVSVLRGAGVPVVETWGWSDSPIDDLVGFSNHDATAELVREMFKDGYRRIAYAGSTLPDDHRSLERVEGFRSAHRELFGIAAPQRFVEASAMPLTLDAGEYLLDEIMSRFPDTDLALFSTDILANGALLAAVRRGMKVPEDLGIAGFGDFELSARLTPALTTVAVPANEIGKIAGGQLLEKMEGRRTDARSTRVRYSIERRQST